MKKVLIALGCALVLLGLAMPAQAGGAPATPLPDSVGMTYQGRVQIAQPVAMCQSGDVVTGADDFGVVNITGSCVVPAPGGGTARTDFNVQRLLQLPFYYGSISYTSTTASQTTQIALTNASFVRAGQYLLGHVWSVLAGQRYTLDIQVIDTSVPVPGLPVG